MAVGVPRVVVDRVIGRIAVVVVSCGCAANRGDPIRGGIVGRVEGERTALLINISERIVAEGL